MDLSRKLKYAVIISDIVQPSRPAHFYNLACNVFNIKSVGEAIMRMDKKVDDIPSTQVLKHFQIEPSRQDLQRKSLLASMRQIDDEISFASQKGELCNFFKHVCPDEAQEIIDSGSNNGMLSEQSALNDVNAIAGTLGKRAFLTDAYAQNPQPWLKSMIAHANMATNALAFIMLAKIVHGEENVDTNLVNDIKARAHFFQMYDDVKDAVKDGQDAERIGEASPNYFLAVPAVNNADLTAAFQEQTIIMDKIIHNVSPAEKFIFNLIRDNAYATLQKSLNRSVDDPIAALS